MPGVTGEIDLRIAGLDQPDVSARHTRGSIKAAAMLRQNETVGRACGGKTSDQIARRPLPKSIYRSYVGDSGRGGWRRNEPSQ